VTALDPRFPCLSPDSAEPDAIPLRHQIEEIARELEQRRAAYPRWVDKGQLAQYDADRQVDMLRCILADLRWNEAIRIWAGQETAEAWAEVERRRARALEELTRFPWSQLVGELQREILMRRRAYPKWIRGGTLDPDQARHRLERFEAVHFNWWRWGNHFMPDGLTQAAIGQPGEARDRFTLECRAHRALFDPDGRRGEYASAGASQPPAQPEPELAFA
jgi:hypothetical protein